MKNNLLIKLSFFIVLMVLHSCGNDDEIISEESQVRKVEYVSLEEMSAVKSQITDSTIYEIEGLNDLGELTKLFSAQENELLKRGWVKAEPLTPADLLTRASIKKYTVPAKWWVGDLAIEHVKCKFSQRFCDEFNNGIISEYKIKPGERYICEWRQFGCFYNLKPGERAGLQESPKAGYLPSKRDNFDERGYEAYLSPDGKQFQAMTQVIRIKWADVDHSTIIIGSNFPWDANFEVNYAVLSR